MEVGGAGWHEVDDKPPLRPALTLTEEELLVLTNGALGAVPARLAEPEDPAVADHVRAVALRCLMARGLVTPTGTSPPTGAGQQTRPSSSEDPCPPVEASGRPGVAWVAAEPLGLTLTLRELAPTVLALRRDLGALDEEAQVGGPESAGTSAIRYLHLHPDITVIEDVTDDGMHSFLPVFPDRYQDAVAEFIKPPDAVAGHGGVHALDGTVEELLEALGNPIILVETNLVTGLGKGPPPAEPVRRMLAMGPGGSFLSHDSITYHPVDPDGAIADLLREALGEAQACDAGVGEGSGAGAGGPT